MAVEVPTTSLGLLNPSSMPSVDAGFVTIASYIDADRVRLGALEYRATASEDAKAAVLELVQQLKAMLPTIVEGLKPLPSTTALMTAIDGAETALGG